MEVESMTVAQIIAAQAPWWDHWYVYSGAVMAYGLVGTIAASIAWAIYAADERAEGRIPSPLSYDNDIWLVGIVGFWPLALVALVLFAYFGAGALVGKGIYYGCSHLHGKAAGFWQARKLPRSLPRAKVVPKRSEVAPK